MFKINRIGWVVGMGLLLSGCPDEPGPAERQPADMAVVDEPEDMRVEDLGGGEDASPEVDMAPEVTCMVEGGVLDVGQTTCVENLTRRCGMDGMLAETGETCGEFPVDLRVTDFKNVVTDQRTGIYSIHTQFVLTNAGVSGDLTGISCVLEVYENGNFQEKSELFGHGILSLSPGESFMEDIQLPRGMPNPKVLGKTTVTCSAETEPELAVDEHNSGQAPFLY